jgi:AcrR family transcriptional regulator
MTARGAYHHGNLRRAVLDATAAVIAERGVTGFGLREVARRAGVSHTAPAHHFGDATGLLTAFAVEGFTLLGAALAAAPIEPRDPVLGVGIAYVRFAVDHRPHFEVMFRPDVVRADDPELAAARAMAIQPLTTGLRAVAGVSEAPSGPADRRAVSRAAVTRSAVDLDAVDLEAVALGAWAQVHGLAVLLVTGNIPDRGETVEALVRRVSTATDAAVLAWADPARRRRAARPAGRT